MSGILGIVNLDGAPVDRDLLSRMTSFMSFRGPDGQDTWIDGDVGFGHTLLRTIRETESETQPLTLDGKVWLTADARIDGRELSHGFADDAESILHAYQKWGEECVNHLIGDFAFAIWDSRERRLFCARDHFGVKPFFFAHVANSFIFSNTLNALRIDARVSDALNETAIADYLLVGLNQDLTTTTFRDIQRLPASHTLSISNGSIATRRYWTPSVPSPIRFRKAQSYVDRFNELLSTATKDRLRTERVAISMSGGLDSTSVAVAARDLLPESGVVQTFTAVYDSLIPDQERHYSALAAASIGVPVHHLKADDYFLYKGQAPGDLDQPEPFLLSPLTGQFNDLLRLFAGTSPVALTGWDGDALMTEPPRSYLAAAARQVRLKDLVTSVGWFVYSQRRLPPVGFRTAIRRKRARPEEIFCPEWIDESFAKRVNLRERLRQFWSEAVDADETRPATLRALQSKVWAPLFEGYDAGATRLPLEVRHPLIDLRLVNYVLAIPAIPWCVNKHILRQAMKDRLPAAVVNRPKTPLAGNPALQLSRRASVRWLDSFDVTPQLTGFVNLKLRRSPAEEQTPDALWANLRVFALNHWLAHSLPIDRRMVA